MKKSQKDADRILTLHPQGKNGVRIERAKYDEMRRVLLRVTPRNAAGIAFAELPQHVRPLLDPAIYPEGAAVKWYLVTVKQDLEARALIEQVPGARPQRLRRRARAAR